MICVLFEYFLLDLKDLDSGSAVALAERNFKRL